MDRAQQRLPLPPEQWSKICKEQTCIGTELIELTDHYRDLEGSKAWQHFQGMLFGLKDYFEKGILQGVYENGQDKTPELRSAYGILLQILAIPEQVKSRTLMKEYEAALIEQEQDLTNYMP